MIHRDEHGDKLLLFNNLNEKLDSNVHNYSECASCPEAELERSNLTNRRLAADYLPTFSLRLLYTARTRTQYETGTRSLSLNKIDDQYFKVLINSFD